MGNLETFNKREYVEPQCQCEKPMTNADRIRNMTDEELLDFLCEIDTYRVDGGQILWIDGHRMEDTRENISIWLQSEVKEG